MANTQNDHSKIWLKISNTRLQGDELFVQMEGDLSDPAARWWKVSKEALWNEGDPASTYRGILDGLDNNRVVLGALAPVPSGAESETNHDLACEAIRVQYADTRRP